MSANGAPAPAPRPAALPTGELAAPQYAQGFEGMASAPFPDDVRAVLAETPAHEDVQIKPDGIVFMPGVWWRRQLTRAFGAGGWALAPRGPTRTVGNGVEYHGALYCLGRWVAEATGGCESNYMSHADMVESARTDCLSKCCKDLGMASELWEKDWREAWQREYAEKYTVQSGRDQGKERWRLKQRRDPKAANLLGVPPEAPAPSNEPAKPEQPAPAGDTGEAASPEAYAAVKAQIKRLKITEGSARTFLAAFGVATVDALTAAQADGAQALLLAWGKKDMYGRILDELRGKGLVRAKGGVVTGASS